MKFTIELGAEAPDNQIAHLKEYLETEGGDMISDLDIDRAEAKEGEMGAGIMGSITGMVLSLTNPLGKLSDVFANYTSSFRTELIIKNEYGDELVLNTKKLDEAGIHLLIEKFLIKKDVTVA